MSLVTKRWSFKNCVTDTVKVVEAIDGPTASKMMGIDPRKPTPWDIRCVCICGAAQSTSFCSETCFRAWKRDNK